MEISISLSPDGGLRLHLPTGRQRTLDVPATGQGARFIVKMLKSVSEGKRDEPGHIGEFPTQAVVETWLRQDRDARAKAAAKAAAQTARDAAAARGIDLDKLNITL